MVNPNDCVKWPEGVPKTIDIPKVPLFHFLDDAVKKYPNAPALVLETGSFTKIGKMNYQELGVATDKLASFLVEKGIKKGDSVAVFLPNMIEFVVAYYGILKAGATVVSLNFQYPPSELKGQLIQSEAKGIICADMITPDAQPYETVKKVREMGGTNLEFIVVASVKIYLSKLKGILAPLVGKVSKPDKRDIYMHEILAKYDPSGRPKVDISPDDLAVIMFTGGTTGTPKGAMLTHGNLVTNVYQCSKWMVPALEYGKTVGMGSLPFYHSFGATTAMNLAVLYAGLCVLMVNPREGKFTQLLHLLQKYKCVFFNSVPTLYIAILNSPEMKNYDLSSIRISVSGAAPMPVAVLKKYMEVTGANFAEGYGLTETSPVACANPMAPFPGETELPMKAGSVGLPFPDTDILILDAETGMNPLPQGEEGEIAISGGQVMAGYFKKPDATAEVMREINGRRYFLTGDIGKYDEDNYLFITDRKKDMIDVGGFKAYPREIEEVLIAHKDIVNAAVIGVPHPKVGETVKIFVVPDPESGLTKTDVLIYCQDKLVKYKQPHSEEYIEFRTELPMTQVGKVLRRALRDE